MKNLADILFVIDLQADVCTGLWQLEKLLTQVNSRISDYREAGKPVLFIQHNDDELLRSSSGWRLVPELDSRASDLYAEKTHANAFYQTDLQTTLEKFNVNSIEFCGAETPFCVNTTLIFAHGLGYKCQMQHGAASMHDLPHLAAAEGVPYYEDVIWNHRFLKFVD